MTYPLFDSGYILWAADVEARLTDQLGQSAHALGIDPRLLLKSYYGGETASATLAKISVLYGLDGLCCAA